MLMPQDLRSIRLKQRPIGQRILKDIAVRPSWWLNGVRIEAEGLERIADAGPALIAMNHTDRYNYWGLQVALAMQHDLYTSCWVKGKYYEHWFSGMFMHSMSNIPVASRGYLIAASFQARTGRPPNGTEYRQLRNLVDAPHNTPIDPGLQSLLGQAPTEWVSDIESLFAQHSREVVRLTGEALSVGLQVLIFPEGTRSVRLTRGRIGIAEMACHFRVPIVPVGCSGSHHVYPGNTPWPKRGTVHYRVGEPIHPDDPQYADLAVSPGFEPFAHQTRIDHGAKLQGLVDTVVDRIALLVDDAHKPDGSASNTPDVGRFI